MPVGLVWDERYLAHAAPDHPESPARLTAIREALQEAGLWDRLAHIPARRATQDELLRVHSRRHVQDIQRSAAAEDIVWFDSDTYACPASWDSALLAAGGVFAAADAVMSGEVPSAFCAVRPPGHHASADRPMGFCLFNNVALAVRHVQAAHGITRVLVVDWDVHHGNGTQDIFYHDRNVFYMSAHQWPLYPGTGRREETGEGPGAGTTRNYPLRAGSGDGEFLSAIDDGLAAAEALGPEFIFISAGFDAHRDDPLAGLALTESAYAEATRRIRRLAERTAAGRIVSVLEGGYHLDALGRSAAAHIEALG